MGLYCFPPPLEAPLLPAIEGKLARGPPDYGTLSGSQKIGKLETEKGTLFSFMDSTWNRDNYAITQIEENRVKVYEM